MQVKWQIVVIFLLGFVFALLFAQTNPPIARAQSPEVRGVKVGTPVRATSFDGDVRRLAQTRSGTPRQPRRAIPVLDDEPAVTSPRRSVDPKLQTRAGSIRMPSPNANFKGLTFNGSCGPAPDDWCGSGWPPDPNGDVGPNHYIETVNDSIGIYNKTGTQLAAFTFNNFFGGSGIAGTPCDEDNVGDVIVVYDPLADRWLVSDFAFATSGPPNYTPVPPYYECIAISKTSDPVNGGWWQYALLADSAALNDYPKIGVWPDAYYMTANMFPNTPASVRVWALDRASMLFGGPLNNQIVDLLSPYRSLLPSNMRGIPPPTGSPNYLAARSGASTLQLFQFHVDWANPANSTFAGPTNLAITSWSVASNIPQLGTAQTLDALSSRLLMQNQYRNIGNTEAIWLNHTINPGTGIAAVRWYEIRNPNGTPFVYQEGTFQPDANHRWMGSLAVDRNGNMAIGYSVSSATMYPAIRYAGRLVADPLGTLGQGESSLIEGTGAQTTYNRWGDYTAMSVDPMDDCTFWYVNEYYETTGVDWQTRIGSFKFPTCAAPPINYIYYFPFVGKQN